MKYIILKTKLQSGYFQVTRDPSAELYQGWTDLGNKVE